MAESLSWRNSCVKSELKTADEFSYNATRLQRLVYRDTEEFRSQLSAILEELNSLDYSSHGQSEEVSDSYESAGVANYCSGCSDCSGRLSSAAEGLNQPSALLRWSKL